MTAQPFALAVVVAFAAVPASAQSTARTDFRGDPATEAATAVKSTGLDALKGVRTVYIPQFTVEFIERSDGLSAKEEKRQDYVRVAYRLDAIPPADEQALTDRLYARWVAGLQAQGLTVHGPRATMGSKGWAKLAKNARPAPARIRRSSGDNRIYSVEGVGYLLPLTAVGETPTDAEATASGVADTGAAVGSKVSGKLGGMFGLARGLSKMGSGLSAFGGAWNYVSAESAMAKNLGAGVMTVRLVVGLRDIDMAGRGFGLFRTAGSYDGKPRLVIQGEASEVTVTTPSSKRAQIAVPKDLVFAEDVLKGRLAVANSTGASVSNAASRAVFATAAIGGGGATINQSHTFAATPDPAAYAGAVERNLGAVESIFLQHLSTAW